MYIYVCVIGYIIVYIMCQYMSQYTISVHAYEAFKFPRKVNILVLNCIWQVFWVEQFLVLPWKSLKLV